MEETTFPDERLELIFTCCHPALALEAQVALTLRTLGGLRTEEIARAFLVPEETMKRRLSRAKQQDQGRGHPVPRSGRPPLAGAAGSGAGGRLPDLQRGLRRPRRPRGGGAPARRGARRADAGRARGARAPRADAAQRCAPRGPVRRTTSSCCSQTRTGRAGTRAQIARGREALDRAFALRGRGAYVIQAAIASLHMEDPLDWPQIAALYGELVRSDRLGGRGAEPRDRRSRGGRGRKQGWPSSTGSSSTATSTSTRRAPTCCAGSAGATRRAPSTNAPSTLAQHRARAPLPATARRGIQRLQLDEQGLTRRTLTLAVPSDAARSSL